MPDVEQVEGPRQRTANTTFESHNLDATPSELKRRRSAAKRCAPLASGARDPWTPGYTRRPSTFGLTPDEVRNHALDLFADGWPIDQIRLVLDIPLRSTCGCHGCKAR